MGLAERIAAMSPTINAILKVALNPKNQVFRPQKPQYAEFKGGNL